MRIPLKNPFCILALCICLAALGCGDDADTPLDPGVVDDFPAATTPDQAMANFEKAWEKMNFAEYSKLLSDQFQFFFDPEANLEEYVGGPSWQLASELAAVEALFSNQPGSDPVTVEPIPPILSIQFESFQALDPDWQAPPDGPLYENTVRQRYAVSMRVTYQGEELTTRVRGEQFVYVTPVEEGGKTLWMIKVWEDKGQTGKSGDVDEGSWGKLKSLWAGVGF